MATYTSKNRHVPGGEVFEVGGELRILEGGKITPATGTQAATIAARPTDLSTSANGTAIAAAVNGNAEAINAILLALEGAGIIEPE